MSEIKSIFIVILLVDTRVHENGNVCQLTIVVILVHI